MLASQPNPLPQPGRGGETIKDLALQSGCKMNMVQDGMYANAPEKPLRMHGTAFQIQKARELVSGIIQQQEVLFSVKLDWKLIHDI